MQNQISINFSEFIQIHNNQTITTSEFVAKAFNKNHKDVLRKIDEILTQVPDFFGKRNFTPTESNYKNNLGFDVPSRTYELTKDGFMLLVMGFTGKQAMQIKIAYIEAFNKMAEMLAKQNSGSLKPTSPIEQLENMPTRSDLWNLYLTLMDILKDVNGWGSINFEEWVGKNNPRRVSSDKLTYQELLDLIRKMHAILCSKYHYHPLQNFYKHAKAAPALPQTVAALPQPSAPTPLSREVFEKIVRVFNYAQGYQKIQDILCNHPYSKEANDLMTSFQISHSKEKTGYLFVFKPDVDNDIKFLGDWLHFQSAQF